MTKLFSMDIKKDMKLIGQKYYWLEKENRLKVRLNNITLDGYYEFIVIDKESIWESFTTKIPNSGDIQQ